MYHIKFFMKLSLQIIILFVIAMLYSLIVDYIRSFLGDIPCLTKDCGNTHGNVDPNWDWGARHYWFMWMGIVLFIVQIIRIVVFITVETTEQRWNPK